MTIVEVLFFLPCSLTRGGGKGLEFTPNSLIPNIGGSYISNITLQIAYCDCTTLGIVKLKLMQRKSLISNIFSIFQKLKYMGYNFSILTERKSKSGPATQKFYLYLSLRCQNMITLCNVPDMIMPLYVWIDNCS